eukprot:scaffold1503_cov250-Pinguiococcus_pyrenoidosus.AAC.22
MWSPGRGNFFLTTSHTHTNTTLHQASTHTLCDTIHDPPLLHVYRMPRADKIDTMPPMIPRAAPMPTSA